MWFVIGLLMTVVLLMVVASVLPGLRIDGPGAALIAAAIARVITLAAGVLLAPAFSTYITGGGWIAWAATFVIPVIALIIGIAFTPGITVNRAVSVPIAALLVVGLRFGAMFGIQSAIFEARNPAMGVGPFGF